MTEALDDLSGIPRYRQLATIIESEIRAGRYAPGAPAPSRTALTQRYGVARETIAKAYRVLRGRGLVVTVPGIGMAVAPPERWSPPEAG